jgi:hypothetical protein
MRRSSRRLILPTLRDGRAWQLIQIVCYGAFATRLVDKLHTQVETVRQHRLRTGIVESQVR